LSSFIGLNPSIKMKIHNLPMKLEYPSEGSVEAIVDTGYGGFLAVPRRVFEALQLDTGMTQSRRVEVADGRLVRSKIAYATVELEGANREVDGLVETFEGLTELLIGRRLLSHFRLTLDYCLRVLSIRPCC
jgi:clan AA aspartic protease